MSVETFSEGEYLPSVRQVVQDLRSFGVGVKHIGQTMQTVLKHRYSEFCFLKYAMLLFALRFSDSTVSSFYVSSFSFFISA
jgi:lipoate synthase